MIDTAPKQVLPDTISPGIPMYNEAATRVALTTQRAAILSLLACE